MDEARVCSGLGLHPKVLGNAAVAHPEQQDIPACFAGQRTLQKPATGCVQQDLAPLRLGPVLGIGWHCLGLGPVQLAPETAQKTQAIRPCPLHAGLVQIGCSDPLARLKDDCLCGVHCHAPVILRPPEFGRPGTG